MMTIARFPSQQITAEGVRHLVEVLKNKTVRELFNSFVICSVFHLDNHYIESVMQYNW